MSKSTKTLESLTAEDVQHCALWEIVEDASGRILCKASSKAPAIDLAGRVVATRLQLSCGDRVWALLGNISLQDARSTRHFLTASLLCPQGWFHLARYHDFDYSERGPAALAAALGRPLNDVFPIAYDIRAFAHGDADVVMGSISAEPVEVLSRAELIQLAL